MRPRPSLSADKKQSDDIPVSGAQARAIAPFCQAPASTRKAQTRHMAPRGKTAGAGDPSPPPSAAVWALASARPLHGSWQRRPARAAATHLKPTAGRERFKFGSGL